jgi:alanyl-tRNA synthetase
LLRKIATTAGGRGGGRADHAEGRLPRGADIADIVRRLRA